MVCWKASKLYLKCELHVVNPEIEQESSHVMKSGVFNLDSLNVLFILRPKVSKLGMKSDKCSSKCNKTETFNPEETASSLSIHTFMFLTSTIT